MGGTGSGPRITGKEITSSYRQIDVRWLQRNGLLVVGRSFVFDLWDVSVIDSIKRDEPQLVILSRRDKSERQNEPYRIWLEWTLCNYGGARPWFVCPRGCGNRVAILYCGPDPGCRHCYKLAYQSQRESRKHRALHQAQEIRIRLGGSGSLADDFPSKPKSMTWRTYQCLFAKAMASENVFWISLAGWLSKHRR
jgi:hypothetical protein